MARNILIILALRVTAASPPTVTLHGASAAHRYDGHGALSAGASSRLLVDYPSPQREEILDLLFKPHHGLSLHTLKVEIGGDTQSTDGTEPSHARSKAEMDDCNVERGYESWLVQEAKKRNPDIAISALAWGVPGWINSGDPAHPGYFNRDNIDYHVSWMKCMKEKLGVSTDYLGIWNERPWGNTDYVTELRAALDDAGFGKDTTGIVMLDGGGLDQTFKHALMTNSTFADAIEAVGLHYPCDQPDADIVNVAKKKFWASEDFSTPADWAGAGCWGRMLNSNYVRMNMTSTISWSLLWSVYPNLDCFGNGLMYAFEPWSGHYEVNPTVWATAHTTQFAHPGWHYLRVGPDGGSGELPGGGGTYVTLRSPAQSDSTFDWSLVIETLAGQCMYHAGCLSSGSWTASRMVKFQLTGFGLGEQKSAVLHLWATNSTHQFLQLPDIEVTGGAFWLAIAPDSIYTVTTTTGQSKAGGPDAHQASPPASAPFPLPFAEDFESYKAGSLAKYWSDQAGSFEVAVSPTLGAEKKVLQQVVLACPIQWAPNADPFTLAGSVNWTDFAVSVDASVDGSVASCIPASGCGGAQGSNSEYVSLCGRVSSWAGFKGGPISGYCLRVAPDGTWTLSAGWPVILASGMAPSTRHWRRLHLAFSGPTVSAAIDGREVARISSTAFSIGLVALSSGWHSASFDNFTVEPVKSQPPVVNGLVARVQTLTFDYNKRTCDPHPEATSMVRNNFNGKVGLQFTVAPGRRVRITSLLRYMVDGNTKSHSLELFERRQQGAELMSIANATVDMRQAAKTPLDPLGFAQASLSEPVVLHAGNTYFLMSSEVVNEDAWMDQLPVEVAASSPFKVVGSAYLEAGERYPKVGMLGAYAYGPVSLYFDGGLTDEVSKLFV